MADAKAQNPWSTRTRPSQRAVTIFGAGVAGLTAAHELIERGYRVEVWEPARDERVGARGCAVGGMARTQWSAVEWPAEFDDGVFTEPMPEDEDECAEWWQRIQAHDIVPIESEYYVTAGDHVVPSCNFTPQRLGADLPDKADLIKALCDRPQCKDPSVPACVYIECLLSDDLSKQHPAAIDKRVRTVTEAILGSMGLTVEPTAEPWDYRLEAQHEKDGQKEEWIFEVRYFNRPASEPVPPNTEILLRFRRRERWLPGEHGYRFFPSFYSHLFDTMSRTPLLVPELKSELNYAQELAEFRSVGKAGVEPDRYTYVESGKTVFDDLTPAEVHALAFQDKNAPIAFPRYRVGSLVAVLREWRTAMERFGFAPRDLARYVLRIQEFAVMSAERRARLGNISWWTFVGGDETGYYTQNFKQKIARWAEGLVAMSTEDCDAHTYGNIMLQLISDQYRSERDYRDGILNGPTSDAWLDPWRRYLEAQGVRFIHGEIVDFGVRDGKLWPVVNCFEPRYPGALEGKPALLQGYFVLALPAGRAQLLARNALKLLESERIEGDQADFKALAALELGDLSEPRPQGMLRHFAGVQFYFPEDLSWVHGHVYYPDAPWGLSSISQVRYWQQKRDWEHGYRGVMSVIIGAWDVRSPETKKTAWESEPHEIAQEVWRQLRIALQGKSDPRLGDVDSDEMLEVPNPIYWRLDAGFTQKPDGTEGYDNQTPLLISSAGTWDKRPGRLPVQTPEEDGSPGKDGPLAYAIFGNVVLCGTYMKTFTRLTTMESANESARHAVNAILLDRPKDTRPSKLCKIFPLEHREPADFALAKDVDRRLAQMESDLGGDPARSFVEALGLDRWTAFIPKRRSP
jgi:hypothetical protein